MPKCDIIINLGKDYSSELEEDLVYTIKDALDEDSLGDYPLLDVAEFLTGRTEEINNLLKQINGFFKKSFVSKTVGVANSSILTLTETIPVEGGWNKEFENLPEFKTHNILYLDTYSPKSNKKYFTDKQSGIIIVYRDGVFDFKGHLESKLLLLKMDLNEDDLSDELKEVLEYFRKKEKKPELTIKELFNDLLGKADYIYLSDYTDNKLDPILVLEDEINRLLSKPSSFKYATYLLTALCKRIEPRKNGKHWISVPSVIKILNLDESELKEIDTSTDKGRQEYRRKLKDLVDKKTELDKDFPYKFSSVEFDEDDHSPVSVKFNKVARDSINKLYLMEYEDCYLNFTHVDNYRGYRIYMRKEGNINRYYYTKELIHPDLWLSLPYNTEGSIKEAIDKEAESEIISEGNIILDRFVGSNLIYFPGASVVRPGYTFRIAEVKESKSSSVWKNFYSSTVKELKDELKRLKRLMSLKDEEYNILLNDISSIINLTSLINDPDSEVNAETIQNEILIFKRRFNNLFPYRFLYVLDKVNNIFENLEEYISEEGSQRNLETINYLLEDLQRFDIKEKYNEVLENVQKIRRTISQLLNLDEKTDRDGKPLTDDLKIEFIKEILDQVDHYLFLILDYIPIKSLQKLSKDILRNDNLARINFNIKVFIGQLNNIFSELLFTDSKQIDLVLSYINDKDSALAFINLISNLQYSYNLERDIESLVIDRMKYLTYTYYEVVDKIGKASCIIMPVKLDATTKRLRTKKEIPEEGTYDSINKRLFINNLAEWIGELVEGSGYDVKILTEKEIKKQYPAYHHYASGFVSGNSIIINSTNSNLTTPLHEYIHIFFGIFKAINPKIFYLFLDNLMENKNTKEEIEKQMLKLKKKATYSGMAYYDLVEEAFAEVYTDKIIRFNKKVFGEDFKLDGEIGLKENFKDIFDNVSRTKDLNIEEILKLPLFKLTDLISILKDKAILEEEEKEREKIIREINENARIRRIKTNIIKSKITKSLDADTNINIIENCK